RQSADLIGSHLTDQLRREARVGYRERVHQRSRWIEGIRAETQVRCVEHLGALLEEGPILLVEDRELPIRAELQHIGCDFGEIGIHCRGLFEVGAQHPARIETALQRWRSMVEVSGGALSRVGANRGDRGNHLKVGGSRFDGRRGAHRQHAAEGAAAVEIHGLAEELMTDVARPVAKEYEPPTLWVRAVGKFDRGERYSHDHLIARSGARGSAAPDRIPGREFVVLLSECVPFRATGRTEYLVRPLRIVEGTQENTDVVIGVAADVIVLPIAKLDVTGMGIVRVETQPQRICGVAGIDLGGYRRGGVVLRIHLITYGEVRGVLPRSRRRRSVLLCPGSQVGDMWDG